MNTSHFDTQQIDTKQNIDISSSKDIGMLIRHLRKQKGLTQSEAAGLCGVGKRFFSELENGKATLQIQKLLHVLSMFGLVVNLRKRGSSFK